MALLSYRRHRFPPEVIQHAIWLYLRFTLSYRDVEELLAERGRRTQREIAGDLGIGLSTLVSPLRCAIAADVRAQSASTKYRSQDRGD